jgi:iron complex outermembrane receptor protein
MIRHALLASASLLSIVIAADTASAQQAPAPAGPPASGAPIEDITVTARRREERNKDVPIAVTAQPRQELEDKRVSDTVSAMRDVPGVELKTFGDRGNAFITIRGVGALFNPLSPDDSSVVTFVDGAPQPLYGSSGSYLDLQRVEVLKGPQNTLFGRNTSAGAINLIPVLPGQRFEGYLRTEFGTGGTRKLEGAIGGPIVPGVLAARVAFRLFGANGYIPNDFGPKLGAEQGFTGRASLLFTPSARTSWLVSVQGERSVATPAYYILDEPGFPIRGAQQISSSPRNTFSATSKFSHQFDAFTFSSLTSYAMVDLKNRYDLLDYNIANRLTGFPQPAFVGLNLVNWARRETKLTQELRLSSNPGERVAWTVGATAYFDRSDNNLQDNAIFPILSGRRLNKAGTDGYAAFGDVSLPLVGPLTLSLGGRIAHERKTFDGLFIGDGRPGIVPQFAETGRKNYTFWTGRAALSYEWSRELTTYASIARGYKSGGFSYFTNGAPFGNATPAYDPAASITYEIGAKGIFLDGRARLNAALFYNDVKNEQYFAFDFATVTTRAFNLNVRSFGGEIDGSFRIIPGLELTAGAAYTFAQVQDVPAAAAAFQPGLRSGNRAPNVPLFTAKAGLAYRAPVGELGLSALGPANLVARVNYNFTGAQFGELNNITKIKSYHLVSARLGLEWENAEIYAFADNLLDERFKTASITYGPGAFGGRVDASTIARGRVVGVGAGVKF